MVRPPPKLAHAYAPPAVILPPPDDLSRHRYSRSRRYRHCHQEDESRAVHEIRRMTLETSSSSSSSTGSPTTNSSTASSSTNTGTTSRSCSSTGWSTITFGSTVVTCSVEAPVVVSTLPAALLQSSDNTAGRGDSHPNLVEEGLLVCSVRFASYLVASAGTSSSSNAPTTGVTELSNFSSSSSSSSFNKILVSRQERRLERLLRQALAPSVPLSQYHKCAVLVQVTIVDPGENHGILFSNGSGSSSSITVAGDALLPACVLASSLALADANVELYDTVTCGRVAVVVEEYLQEEEGVRATSSRRPLVLVDPTTEEEDGASAVLTIAMMTGWKEVTYWKQCGNLTTAATTTAGMDVLNHAMELCAEQCRVLRKFVARHLHGHATVPASAVATADPRRHQP